MSEPSLRLAIVLDDESLLGAARSDDPVDIVVLRSTFLNPPRGAAARRMAERVRELHPHAELIPYAWHYLTHERGDGIDVGSNRALGQDAGSYGHLRGDALAHVWEITKICATAMGASRVFVRTPPSFSTGTLSRRRFSKFVESLAADEPKLVWEPEGLWEPAEAVAFAEPLGVEVCVPAFSLTGAPLEFANAGWLRISGSKDGQLRSAHAEVLAHEIADTEIDRTILFDGRRAYANLRRFANELTVAV